MIRIYCLAHDRADCGPCAKSGRLKPKQTIRPRDRRRMQDDGGVSTHETDRAGLAFDLCDCPYCSLESEPCSDYSCTLHWGGLNPPDGPPSTTCYEARYWWKAFVPA